MVSKKRNSSRRQRYSRRRRSPIISRKRRSRRTSPCSFERSQLKCIKKCLQTNPLMHVMAVSNHTRYYRPPCGLTAASEDMTTIPFMRVLKIYNSYLKKTNKPLLKIVCKKYNRTKKRSELIQKLKIRKVTQNMVLETFQLVQKIVKKHTL